MYEKHRQQINQHHTFSLNFHYLFNSRLEEQIRYLREQISFTNLDNDRKDDWKSLACDYSLNKRKRWLLPDMLRELADNYEQPEETETKDTLSDESTIPKGYDLFVHFYHAESNRALSIDKYFDNRGIKLPNRLGTRLNIDSLVHTRDGLRNTRKTSKQHRRDRRRARRVVNLVKYGRQRRVFKNGNRNRNSGIKRHNETFVPELEPHLRNNRRRPSKCQISFWFESTHRTLTRPKWPRTIHRRLPQYLKCNSYFTKNYQRFKYWIGPNQRRRARRKYKKKAKKRLVKEIKHQREEEAADFNLIHDDIQETNRNQLFGRRKFTLKDYISKNKTMHKSRPVWVKPPDELEKPRKIIYLPTLNPIKEQEDNENTIFVPDLIDLKISVENVNDFVRSVESDNLGRLVGECVPAQVLVPFKSSYLVFSMKKNDNDFLGVKFNPNVREDEFECLATRVDQEVRNLRFSSLSQLLSIISPLITDNPAKQTSTKPNKQFASLFGVNSSRQLDSIVNEISSEMFKSNQIEMKFNENDYSICPVCYSDETSDLIRVCPCGHWACRDCWRSYVSSRLTDSSTSRRRIECMHEKCKSILNQDVLLTLIPTRMVEIYLKTCIETILTGMSSIYKICSTPDCPGVIRVDSVAVTTVRCSCGASICRLCLSDAHFPSTCSQAKRLRAELAVREKKLREKLGKEKLYESEGKNCPKCGVYFEKNGGCRHMSCSCGNYFCWE